MKLPAGIIEAGYSYKLFPIREMGLAERILVDKYARLRPVDFCMSFSADSVDRLVREKVYATETPISEYTSTEIAYRILRGFGLIELFYWKGPWHTGLSRYSLLTPLGALIRGLIEGKKILPAYAARAVVYSSLIFTTKARIVFDLYFKHHLDTRKFYETVKNRLFGEPVKGRVNPHDREARATYYEGAEKLALEILHEMMLTQGGTSDKFISETEILARFMDNFSDATFPSKRQFANVFEALNRQFRYKHRDRFIYGVGAWETLEAADRISLDQLLGVHELSHLRPLFERLDKEFANIESILQCFYGLPLKI